MNGSANPRSRSITEADETDTEEATEVLTFKIESPAYPTSTPKSREVVGVEGLYVYGEDKVTGERFTVGSSKRDVLSVQGTPDSLTENSFRYGGSFVYFRGDRVAGWDIRYPDLKATLTPDVVRTRTYFTVGSSKDDVLNAQGRPDSFTEERYRYGASYVYFSDGVVTGWDVRHPELKVRLSPATSTAATDSFTIGSTKDEVLTVQGTPDSFSADRFRYGASYVYFRNDLVVKWDSRYPRLKVKLASD